MDLLRRYPTFFLSIFTALLGLSTATSADTFSVVHQGGHIITLTTGNQTYERHELMVGESTGGYTDFGGQGFPTLASDNLNLATYFSRSSASDPTWTVDLGAWTNTNGALDDFFVFEVGGNDAVTVRAIFPSGSLGQPVTLSGYVPTGYYVPAGLNLGQHVKGIGFSITDLENGSGQNLSSSTTIAGLRFESGNIDGSVFCAVDPDPVAPSHILRPIVWPVLPAKTWYPFTLLVKGPVMSELDEDPNPFLDFRLQVEFTGPSGQVYDVPGFYSGNGYAKGVGGVFKVLFTPDEPGSWTYKIGFRSGNDIAVSLDPNAGTALNQNGMMGGLNVQPADPNAPGFYKYGRLEYVGEHYLKFRDGPYFIKGGVGSPENLLSFFGFDDSQDGGNLGIIHRFEPHIADWNPGDPLFVGNTSGVDSKGLIGALNYLASKNVNSVYAILMTLGGDARDVFPFVGAGGTGFENRHMDISKLYRWEQVFAHAQALGIQLHLVFGETEPGNESWLSNGSLGTERKLYYREMIARFGHHLAIKWNLSEENDFTASELASFADYIQAVDPYGHPISVHTHLNALSQYTPLYGDSRYSASSVQYATQNADSFTEQVRTQSANAGRPWVVDMDENGSASIGLSPSNINTMRKTVLYDVLFSGGNIEWYLGAHALPVGGDQNLEDFRTRESMWEQTAYARHFMESELPFHEMQPADQLLSGESSLHGGGEVFAKPGSVYAIYLPKGSPSGSLNLSGHPGTYRKRWFDPRTGAFVGSSQTVAGGQSVPLGAPPYSSGEDWVMLVRKL